jgi:hypothetical protein
LALKKIISNEFRLVSLTLLDEDDSEYYISLRIVREAHAKLGYGEDPLTLLIRLEESDPSETP